MNEETQIIFDKLMPIKQLNFDLSMTTSTFEQKENDYSVSYKQD